MKFSAALFILAGVLCLVFPLVAGVAIELFYGATLSVLGATHFWQTLKATSDGSRPGHIFIALVFLIGGLALLVAPMIGVAVFTLLIGVSFILQGLAQNYVAVIGKAVANRALMVAGGMIAIIGGVLILAEWPNSSIWIVGTLAGINFLMIGLLAWRLDPTAFEDAERDESMKT